jgi:hypothetical protein
MQTRKYATFSENPRASMKLEVVDKNVDLQLTEKQLQIIFACIGHSFASLDKHEFAIRIGAPLEEVATMAEELRSLMRHGGVDF